MRINNASAFAQPAPADRPPSAKDRGAAAAGRRQRADPQPLG
eukprot:gene11822-3468_t